MKKNILLVLVTTLLSLLSVHAAHNHELSYNPSTSTYTGDKTLSNVEEGKYLLTITKETSGETVNLLTAGNFNFECHQTQHKNIDGDNYFGYTASNGITYLMRELNCNADDNTYPGGFTCIKDNANNVKASWFKEVTNKNNDGSKMLVCDGMNSSDFKVWIAENIPVQAGMKYEFSCNVANVDNQYNPNDTNGDHGPNSRPRLRFWVEQNGTKTKLAEFTVEHEIGKFQLQTGETYTAPTTGYCTIYIQNYTTFDEGNDFAIDDIYFGEPQISTNTKFEYFESTMCNTTADSTLTSQKSGDKYIWTYPNSTKEESVLNNIKISHTDTKVGDKFSYSCEIYEYKTAPTPSAPTLANNIIENGGFEDVALVGGEYKGFTSDYEFHSVDKGFDYGKSNRGFMQVSSKESYGITPASGNYMYECDGDDKVNKNRAWIASTDKNPRLKITKGTQYQFSYKAAMQGTTNNPKLTFYIEFNGKKEKLLDTQTLPADSKWHTYGEGIYWTAPEDCNNVTLSLVDDCFKNAGNDFCLDDIMFQPLQNGSSSSTQPTLIATENFEITITNCYTEDSKTHQIKEGETITLIIPEDKRCNTCTYRWYKVNENGDLELITGLDPKDPTYTPEKMEDGNKYVGEVIGENDEVKHTQNLHIDTYKETIISVCYDINADTDKTYPVTGKKADDEWYQWMWIPEGSDTPVEFPEDAIIKTEGENITFNLEYFVNDNNGNLPVKIHILEKYGYKEDESILPPTDNQANEEEKEYEDEELNENGNKIYKDEFYLVINPVTHQDIVETSSPNIEFGTEVKLTYNANNEYITFFYNPIVSHVEGITKYEDYKEATNLYGCPHLVSFTLNLVGIKPDVFFTPNADKINDKWMIEGIESAPNATIMIYDRYSKLLYKCKGADFKGWDGNYNGHGMVQDDYWYVILVPELDQQISGHFILKR